MLFVRTDAGVWLRRRSNSVLASAVRVWNVYRFQRCARAVFLSRHLSESDFNCVENMAMYGPMMTHSRLTKLKMLSLVSLCASAKVRRRIAGVFPDHYRAFANRN
jgi:hypothetical protein